MGVSAEIKALSALADKIQESNVDATTKAALTQSVQEVK